MPEELCSVAQGAGSLLAMPKYHSISQAPQVAKPGNAVLSENLEL